MSGGGFDPTLPPLPINGNDDVCLNPPQYTQQHQQQPTTTKSTVARKRKQIRKKVTELSDDMTKMPQGYTPIGNDVIVGRGSEQSNSPGYKNYRDLIVQNKSRYQEEGNSNTFKASMIKGIVAQLRQMNPPAKFLTRGDDGFWYDVGDKTVYGKVSQSLREKKKNRSKSRTTSSTDMNIPTDAADMPVAVPAKKNTKKVPRSSSSSSSSSMSSMVDEDQPPKKKQKKDAPKRANTAYMIYSNENRQSVKDANPGISLGDQVSVPLVLLNFYMVVCLTYCKIRMIYSPRSCLPGSRS